LIGKQNGGQKWRMGMDLEEAAAVL
jgi:hypothetical protein